MQDTIQSILKFWFDEVNPQQWDTVNTAFDFEVKERFELTYDLAQHGLCDEWQNSPEGALAYVLLMGVLPLKMYRGEHKAYEGHALAIEACNKAIDKGFDQIFSVSKRKFFYLPMLDSSDIKDLDRAAQLCKRISKVDPIVARRANKARSEFANFKAELYGNKHAKFERKELAFVDKN